MVQPYCTIIAEFNIHIKYLVLLLQAITATGSHICNILFKSHQLLIQYNLLNATVFINLGDSRFARYDGTLTAKFFKKPSAYFSNGITTLRDLQQQKIVIFMF